MSKRPKTLVLGTLVAALAAGSVGCAPPKPSEDAALWYLRNASVDGRVRRLWPAGQEWVDNVLQIRAKLVAERNALEAVLKPHTLWAKDNPDWRDAEQLQEHIDQLGELVDGQAFERQKLMRELDEAIDDVPEGLGLEKDPARKEHFIEQVQAAMAPGVPGLRQSTAKLVEAARMRLELYQAVLNAQDELAEGQPGLSFKDAQQQKEIDAMYDAVARNLRAAEGRLAGEHLIEYASKRIPEIRARLKNISDKRAERQEADGLVFERNYLRDQLEAMPKDLHDQIVKAERELEELEEAKVPAQEQAQAARAAKIAYLKGRIERLRAEREDIRQRVASIIAEPKEVAAAE